jgi:histidinol phosphatase-like PHP family hydrolase
MGRLDADAMIDPHTHSILSDGELLPEELVRRCETVGYRMMAISDHVGLSNAETVLPQLVKLCRALGTKGPLRVLPGAEVTHVRPDLIARAVALARKAGALIVIGHGETIVEPVAPGTNRAFIEAGVDVLAHPGLISEEDAALAASRGVLLEISGRKGHCLANGHVLKAARAAGARMVFGSDGHAPGDYPDRAHAERIARGAGMTCEEVDALFESAWELFDRAPRRARRAAGRKGRQ